MAPIDETGIEPITTAFRLYSNDEMASELIRRAKLALANVCYFCRRELHTTSCEVSHTAQLSTVQISIRLPVALKQAIDTQAQTEGIDRTAFIIRALKNHI